MAGLEVIDGLTLAKTPDYADNNHWLNILQIEEEKYNEDRETLKLRLEKNGIQTRPVWYLNHLQEPYLNCQSYKLRMHKK